MTIVNNKVIYSTDKNMQTRDVAFLFKCEWKRLPLQ